MNIDDAMKIIKETFDEEVFAQLEYFLGSEYATIAGKEDFFGIVETKLRKLQDEEDRELGVVRGEDAKRFIERMEKNNEEYEKRKNK